MLKLNELLKIKLGMQGKHHLKLTDLDVIVERMAKTIPFENLSIINKSVYSLSSDNLVKKIIIRNEGGLCFELNPLMHSFLTENGFDAKLIRCMRYDYTGRKWSELGKTHVANLIDHHGMLYLVDIGFGGFSPLKIVPLNGESVISQNGEFKVVNLESGYGDFMFCMKQKHKEDEWRIGYAFDSRSTIQDTDELHEVQRIIMEHPKSNFNKRPLMTKFTDQGSISLTDTFLTEWVNGKVRKVEILDEETFYRLSRDKFGLEVFLDKRLSK